MPDPGRVRGRGGGANIELQQAVLRSALAWSYKQMARSRRFRRSDARWPVDHAAT